MLSLSTASPTKVPGHTVSSTCCLVTRTPEWSISNFRTANALGRSAMDRVPLHKHSLARSSRNGPNDISCITHPTSPRMFDEFSENMDSMNLILRIVERTAFAYKVSWQVKKQIFGLNLRHFCDTTLL